MTKYNKGMFACAISMVIGMCILLISGCGEQFVPQDTEICTIEYRDGTTEKIKCYYVQTDEPILFGRAKNLCLYSCDSYREISLSDIKSWKCTRR